MFVMPSTKQMESRILDLPEPLRPVIELKDSSLWVCVNWRSARGREGDVAYHPEITVRTAYDLKPCEVLV